MHTENRGMLGTTVLCVRKDNKVIIIGDGQVTLGNEIIKPNVRKVRRLGANVIGGFAGQLMFCLTCVVLSAMVEASLDKERSFYYHYVLGELDLETVS
jgi:ATP-dependent protease HslVU (ClpYQ) peptidase subunit